MICEMVLGCRFKTVGIPIGSSLVQLPCAATIKGSRKAPTQCTLRERGGTADKAPLLPVRAKQAGVGISNVAMLSSLARKRVKRRVQSARSAQGSQKAWAKSTFWERGGTAGKTKLSSLARKRVKRRVPTSALCSLLMQLPCAAILCSSLVQPPCAAVLCSHLVQPPCAAPLCSHLRQRKRREGKGREGKRNKRREEK